MVSVTFYHQSSDVTVEVIVFQAYWTFTVKGNNHTIGEKQDLVTYLNQIYRMETTNQEILLILDPPASSLGGFPMQPATVTNLGCGVVDPRSASLTRIWIEHCSCI